MDSGESLDLSSEAYVSREYPLLEKEDQEIVDNNLAKITEMFTTMQESMGGNSATFTDTQGITYSCASYNFFANPETGQIVEKYDENTDQAIRNRYPRFLFKTATSLKAGLSKIVEFHHDHTPLTERVKDIFAVCIDIHNKRFTPRES